MKLTKEKRDELILDNMELAYSVAATFHFQTDEEYEDMKSAAVMGLVEATQRFDPSRGAKFSTYAWYWCRRYASETYRVLRAPVSTPKTQDSVHGLGLDSFASERSVPEAEFVGVDRPMVPSLISDSFEGDTIERLSKEKMVSLLLEVMEDTLTEKEMVCVRLYHGVGCEAMDTSEMSRVLGFSRQAAHQNLTRGMDKFIDALKEKYPDTVQEEITL